jgi:hypothetical protein
MGYIGFALQRRSLFNPPYGPHERPYQNETGSNLKQQAALVWKVDAAA